MECCFCRSAEAIELNPDFPLCATCVEARDFYREYNETKKKHGLSVLEYAQEMTRFYTAPPTSTAAVN